MPATEKIQFKFAPGAATALFKARCKAAHTISRKLGRDWVYSVPEFQPIAHDILRSPDIVTSQDAIIWQTTRNTVWRAQLEGQDGTFDIVYKSRPGRYRINRCVSPSAAVRDAINLLAINSLGFPTTELLAVGEKRSLTHWRYCFIITRFADNFKEVTQILPGKPYGEHPWIKDAVIEASLKALANLHTLRIYHKAFKDYNIMWKQIDDSIELCLFDFETSRTIWLESFEPYLIRDLFDFFRPFNFTDDTLLHWLTVYLAENTSCLALPELVLKKLRIHLKEPAAH